MNVQSPDYIDVYDPDWDLSPHCGTCGCGPCACPDYDPDDLDDCAALAIERDRDDARTIALGMGCDTCGTPDNAYFREGERVFRCDACEDKEGLTCF